MQTAGCCPSDVSPTAAFLKGASHPGRHPSPSLDQAEEKGETRPGGLSEFLGLYSQLLCFSLSQGRSALHTWLPRAFVNRKESATTCSFSLCVHLLSYL